MSPSLTTDHEVVSSISGLERGPPRKPTGKRPLGRPMRRWEDNIRMDLEEIGINWVDSAQDKNYWRALVNAALNFRVPSATESVKS